MKRASVAVFDICGNEPLVFSLRNRALLKIGHGEGVGLNAVLTNEPSLDRCCGKFILGIITNDDGTHSPIMLSPPSISPTVFVNGKAVKLNSEQVILKDGDHLVVACKGRQCTKEGQWGRCSLQYREEAMDEEEPMDEEESMEEEEPTVAAQPRPRTLAELPEEVLQLLFARLDPLFVCCTLPAVCTSFHDAVWRGVPFPEVSLTAETCSPCSSYIVTKFFHSAAIEKFSFTGEEKKEFMEEALPELLKSVGECLKKLELNFTGRVDFQGYPRVAEELTALLKRNAESLETFMLAGGIEDLPLLPQLEELCLNVEGMNLKSCQALLSKTPKLTALNLIGTVSPDFWKDVPVEKLHQLTHAAVTASPFFPFAALKSVKTLAVLGFDRENDLQLLTNALSRMEFLEHFHVGTRHFLGNKNSRKAFLGKLPLGLITLAFILPGDFDDACCTIVAERCHVLENFYVGKGDAGIPFYPGPPSRTGRRGVEGVEALVKNCPKLKFLQMVGDFAAAQKEVVRTWPNASDQPIPECLRDSDPAAFKRMLEKTFGFGVKF